MSRVRVLWVAAALLLSTLAGDSAVLADRLATPDVPWSVAVEKGLVKDPAKAAAKRVAKRDREIRLLFDRRASAILNGNRAAFLADVDPRQRTYRAEQDTVFTSLRAVGFDQWSYDAEGGSYSPSSIDYARYLADDDVWLPVETLRYRIKGFDRLSVGRRVVYTLVKHSGRWWIASDTDLDGVTSSGTSVRVDPWENGPLVVDRTAHALVLGHPTDTSALSEISGAVESAVKHVIKYVGATGWNDRVVIVLPNDKDETNRVLENPQTFFEFAAIAKPLRTAPAVGPSKYAGARVVINPLHFDAADAWTATLLRHEITHVALFERTGPLSPKWLVEGVAEYVGNAESTLSVHALTGNLTAAVSAPGHPDTLPGDNDFGLLDDAGDAYALSWTVCRYIVSRYGRAAMFRLYDEMGNETGLDLPGRKLADALRKVLHTDEATLVRGWRPYARAAVGDLSALLPSPAGYTLADRGETTLSSLAGDGITVPKLQDLGVVRAGQGFWYQGSEQAPSSFVDVRLAVSRDDAAAGAVSRAFTAVYTPYDTGYAVAHGRLYRVRLDTKKGTFHLAVVEMHAGIVTVEVQVGVRSGDPAAVALRTATQVWAAVA